MVLSLGLFLILHPIINAEPPESCLSADVLAQVSEPSVGFSYETHLNIPVLECSAKCSESTACDFFRVAIATMTCRLYSNDSNDPGLDSHSGHPGTEEHTMDHVPQNGLKAPAGSVSSTPTTYVTTEGPSAPCGNVALRKPTDQSSNYDNNRYPSRLAVDGGHDTNAYHGSCSHTDNNPRTGYGWWSVDLMDVYDIKYITIWNRDDGKTARRLSDFTVYVGNQSASGTHDTYKKCIHHPGWFYGSRNLSCDQGSCGRFVKIAITNGEFLSLCEVEVYPRLCKPSE